jgi:hypothetical protein
MNSYKATVRVPHPLGHGTMVVWAEVRAANPDSARQMLRAQYGRQNVVSVPTRCG